MTALPSLSRLDRMLAVNLSDAAPRRRRHRVVVIFWQALLLGFALGGLACLVFLAVTLG